LKPEALMAQGMTAEESVIEVAGIEIETPIGRGGMGSVYLGRQLSLDREVAVKVLASELADDPQFLERLEREARVMARLRHWRL
jgi:serine/threonine protein kinase